MAQQIKLNNMESREFAKFQPATQQLVKAVLNQASSDTDSHIIHLAENLRRSDAVIEAANRLINDRPLIWNWQDWLLLVKSECLKPFHYETFLHLERAFRIIKQQIHLMKTINLTDIKLTLYPEFQAMQHYPLDEADIEILQWAAGVHDLCKMCYPVSYWNTPGKFTPSQRLELEIHTKFYDIFSQFFNVDHLVNAFSILHHYPAYPRNGTVAKVSWLMDDPKLCYMLKWLITVDKYEGITGERGYRRNSISHEEAILEKLPRELGPIGTEFLGLLEFQGKLSATPVICPN